MCASKPPTVAEKQNALRVNAKLKPRLGRAFHAGIMGLDFSAGDVGEIAGCSTELLAKFDRNGELVEKASAGLAALRSGSVNGFITGKSTAERILELG